MQPFIERRAFTLIELSIVLVVIGLLVGGILAGQALIRTSELRTVITEFTNYKAAINAFKNKYSAIPGDMSKATAYWGVAPSCGGSVDTATSTCNGDGDTRINYRIGIEHWLFWRHLANAGLIAGTYSGDADGRSAYTEISPGINVPISKVKGGAWSIYYAGSYGDVDPDGWGTFYSLTGNVLIFGAPDPNLVYTIPIWALLTPLEAYHVDAKMDDGKPNTGAVNSSNGRIVPGCLNDTFDGFRLDNQDAACNLIFNSGY